jgi:lipocalin
VARIICRILLTLALLAVNGFVLLVLIGLWDRYEQKTAASDFSGIHVEDLASQADFSRDPKGGVGREQLAPARFFQQVPKLVGTGAEGSANQGMSVALSADGSTAIVGGPGPNNADRDRSLLLGPAGAAWVFTRSGGVWTQQGNKLVGTTSQYGGGLWSQGASVALSADGNTAIVGGPSDNRTTGAAWVFARSSAVWTQQGDKLVGTGAYEAGEPPLPLGQGLSVALSADGSTAIVGGWRAEAAWVFTRSGAVWTQQGNKLVGSGAVGSARQGMSVALSADGNTAIVGGWSDNSKIGAAWVFTRSGGVWTQQGKKLVGIGAVGSARQGMSVALSGDGNTAIVGGPGDNPWDRLAPFGVGATGAAWVFTRSGAVWTQQGDKLVGTGARQGMSVALSADGNIALVGGFADDGGVGAASVFTRSDGHWTQDKKLAGIGAVGQSAPSVALSADGSIVMVGGPNDNGGIGAAWVLTRTYDYREPLAPSTRPPNPPSLTASTPPLPPPNLEE